MTIVKNREDAEDVLQEAIQRVLIRNRPLPSQDQVRMYLNRAIGNAALEFYNTRMRERRRLLPIQEQLVRQAQIEGPDALMEESERRARKEYLLKILRRELRRLPEKQLQALRLTLLDRRGLSIRDAGAAHGIPYSPPAPEPPGAEEHAPAPRARSRGARPGTGAAQAEGSGRPRKTETVIPWRTRRVLAKPSPLQAAASGTGVR